MPDDEPANHETDDAPGDPGAPTDARAADAAPAQESGRRALSGRRVLSAVGIAALCAALIWFRLYLDDDSWWQVPLIAAGGALAIAAVCWRRRRSNGKHADHRRPRNRFSTAVIATGGALMLIGVNPLYPPDDPPVPCNDPVELRALLPEDGADGFAQGIAEFNKQHLNNDGCRLANVTAYSASWNDIDAAFEHEWQSPPPSTAESEDDAAEEPTAEGGFDPLRDVGPRPDFFVAESRTQVDLAAETSEVVQRAHVASIGTTPLVLAAPEDAEIALEAAQDINAELTLSEMVERLSAQNMPVLRTNPAVSHSGMLFLKALFGADATSTSVTKATENQLSAWAASEGVPMPATNAELLCSLFNPPQPDSEPAAATDAESVTPALKAAVLTTEAALSRYNAGADIGEACPEGGGRTGLLPVYDSSMGALDYQAVSLKWGDDPKASARAEVAEALTRWLENGDAARWQPTDVGIRGVDYKAGVIGGEVGFERDFPVEPEPLTIEEYENLQVFNGANGVDTNVLVAIDHSMSMEELNGDTPRFELAAEAASEACDYLGGGDRLGLWTFPDPAGDSHTGLLDFDEHECGAVADALAGSKPHSAVELHQMMIDGAEAVAADAADDSGDRIKALVVLTDGVDEDDAPTVAEVHAALDRTQVALYVIAVGDVSCERGPFKALTADLQVTCLATEPNQLTTTFNRLYSRLWGDDAEG